LNEAADTKRRTGPPTIREGSVKWVIGKYRETDRYKDLAPGTRGYYDDHLIAIEGLSGDLMFAAIGRPAVNEMLKGLTLGEKRKRRAVLSLLFETAMDEGKVTANQAKVKLKTPPRRQKIVTAEPLERLMAAAAAHEHALTLQTIYAMLLFTVQRPGDCLKALRAERHDGWIRIWQSKGKKWVRVPEHAILTAALDRAEKAWPSKFLISYPDGREVPWWQLNRWSRQVREKAGIGDIQDRDYRRTGIVMMAEAGAQVPMIASISGHTKAEVNHIIETYLPATPRLAKAAITAWEADINSGKSLKFRPDQILEPVEE
jgi:integrase